MNDEHLQSYIYAGFDYLSDRDIPEPGAHVLNFHTNLVSKTYWDGWGRDIRQEALDAMSPFQVLSKSAAVQLMNEAHAFCRTVSRRRVEVLGSWFGQLVPYWHDSFESSRVPVSTHVAFHMRDLDPVAIAVSKAIAPYVSHFLGDALDCKFDEPVTVMWTGVEHFDKAKSVRWLRELPTGSIVVMAGTDMEDDDHASKVYNVKELLEYFDRDATVIGATTIRCSFATRSLISVVV